jgi:hypothetical protein
MDEAVLEATRKQREDEQWARYHQPGPHGTDTKASPSDRQKTYILTLAKTVGLKVDVSTIRDRDSASRFIERLRLLSRQMHGSAPDYEARDRRIAFGMATKLIFAKYLDRHKEFRRSEKFWNEVEELYREYHKRQAVIVGAALTATPER